MPSLLSEYAEGWGGVERPAVSSQQMVFLSHSRRTIIMASSIAIARAVVLCLQGSEPVVIATLT